MAPTSFPTMLNRPDLAERFGRGAIARANAKDSQGNYILSPSDLPPLFFNDTPESAEAITEFVDTVGHPELLEQYGMTLLQQYAGSADGRLDMARVREWEARYASALSALPGLVARVQAVTEAAPGPAKISRKAIRHSSAALFIDHYPAMATRELFEASDPTLAMREILDYLADDQPAIARLRKCAVDHIRDQIGVSAEHAHSYVRFFEAHQPALKALFDEPQMAICENIYHQLRQEMTARRPRRARRSVFAFLKRMR